MIHIQYDGQEAYDPKKYRDDFGAKKNPFRIVVFATAIFPSGQTLELVMKFEKTPSEQQMIDHAYRLLQTVGLMKSKLSP